MKVRKVLAPNPGLYTGPGTNTWVISSEGEAVVIDPGPVESSHREAIEAELADLSVRFVMVTHTHPDHAPLANPLARGLGVPAVGFSPGPEFAPDIVVEDGDVLAVGGSDLRVLFTPGHSDDHVCFLAERFLFTGDHIMGGSTVMISDLSRYLESLARLKDVAIDRMYPGHGPEIDDPEGVIDHYIDHRLEREQQVVAALQAGAGSVGAVVEAGYADVAAELHPLAAFSVAAHLRKLAQEGMITFHEDDAELLWHTLVTLIGRS